MDFTDGRLVKPNSGYENGQGRIYFPALNVPLKEEKNGIELSELYCGHEIKMDRQECYVCRRNLSGC